MTHNDQRQSARKQNRHADTEIDSGIDVDIDTGIGIGIDIDVGIFQRLSCGKTPAPTPAELTTYSRKMADAHCCARMRRGLALSIG